jgi:hypothetical protein
VHVFGRDCRALAGRGGWLEDRFYAKAYGLIWSASAVLFGIVAILLVTPKRMR